MDDSSLKLYGPAFYSPVLVLSLTLQNFCVTLLIPFCIAPNLYRKENKNEDKHWRVNFVSNLSWPVKLRFFLYIVENCIQHLSCTGPLAHQSRLFQSIPVNRRDLKVLVCAVEAPLKDYQLKERPLDHGRKFHTVHYILDRVGWILGHLCHMVQFCEVD